MITKDNLCDLLLDMGYGEVDTGVYEKKYPDFDCSITVDYNKELIIYPEEKGFQVNDRTTSNFDENENFVVLECVDRLLTKGYRPEHIELERRWKLGHSRKSGKADIYVTDSEGKKCLFIIECKTYGDEYRKELKNIDIDGGQLFSYFAQARSAQWLILYASNFTDKRSYITESICSKDDKNDELLAKKDESIKLYKDASEASDLFDVWCETYGKRYTGDIVFNDNINGVICGNTILCHCYSPFFSYSENNGEYIKVMSEIGGRYINLFHATTDFQVNNELQFGVQDYGGFIKSPVGNVYSDKFVLMSILCQINFLLYGIEKWINNEIPTKLRFGYLLYYSLISVIEQINQKLGIALKINSKWKSDRFRNSMAHYKLGIVLKESNLIISDAMFGLTEKIFGEDYYTIKKSIYKELEKLAKQIGAYLDLPQRMVYLQ